MANGNGKKRVGNNGGGQKKIELDWKRFETYCAMQCTQREIADYFNCSEDTIARKVKEHYGSGFAETFKRKRQVGLMSLRRNLFKLSERKGSVAIFLAKNWLGMVDKVEVTGKDGEPIKTEIIVADETTKKLVEGIVRGEGT